MKSYVNEIFTRTYNIDQKLSGKAIPGPPSGGHIDSSALHHSIESMHNDVREIRSAQITQVLCNYFHITFSIISFINFYFAIQYLFFIACRSQANLKKIRFF